MRTVQKSEKVSANLTRVIVDENSGDTGIQVHTDEGLIAQSSASGVVKEDDSMIVNPEKSVSKSS